MYSGKGGVGKRSSLVGKSTVNHQRFVSLEKGASFDLLTMKEVKDAGNGTHEIESALCIPGAIPVSKTALVKQRNILASSSTV